MNIRINQGMLAKPVSTKWLEIIVVVMLRAINCAVQYKPRLAPAKHGSQSERDQKNQTSLCSSSFNGRYGAIARASPRLPVAT
jgi:hypothetical protein